MLYCIQQFNNINNILKGRRFVDIESHDYGGNLVMPWYGIKRPGLDYYLSNLNIYCFVIVKLTRYGQKNLIKVYDERAAGKNADALCSLRFNHYLSKYIKDRDNQELHKRAKYLFVIMDNCVGQNKSQVVLMMFSMLATIGLYDGIVLHFLEAGHSHGSPDVAIAHAKRVLKDNYDVPEEIVSAMNTVHGVDATYIDFRDAINPECQSDYPFRTGWESFFAEHYVPIPNMKGNSI